MMLRISVTGLIGFFLSLSISRSLGREPQDTASSRETETNAKQRIPLQQMRRDVQELVSDVVNNPSFFRRMPTQVVECDPQMFKFIVRYPEVLVNIWDVMGITRVQIQRTGPFTFTADDSVGTTCKCDLIYGNDQVHVYYGSGAYKGNMAPRQITGRCVCVLHSTSSTSVTGDPIITGSMDVFLKLDNLGADLITRTLSPFVGKTADSNFIESAKFISQISKVCESNPDGAQILVSKLQKIDPEIRDEFSRIAAQIGESAQKRFELQQLATLGPTRTQLSASQVVPAPEFQARTDLRASFAERQAEVVPTLQRSYADTNEALAFDPAIRIQATDSDSAPANMQRLESISNGKPQTALLPISPERSIAPAKPNIYMRR